MGEETNKLVGYLAATSRKLEEPLAVVIQSSSAAGKSSVMEAVLAFMPMDLDRAALFEVGNLPDIPGFPKGEDLRKEAVDVHSLDPARPSHQEKLTPLRQIGGNR